MLRSSGVNPKPLDPEIERSLRAIRKAAREAVLHLQELEDNPDISDTTMGDGQNPNVPRALRAYALPNASSVQSAIRRPAIQANSFEIKGITLQLIQGIPFHGLDNEDPTTHIANFLEVCDTVKYNGVSDEAIRLRLFPFSLRDRAKNWLTSLPADSILTWDDLVQKFLARFFPPSRTAQIRAEINNFSQQEGESLYVAWERYKELLRRCPHHGIPKWMQVHNFYNGMTGPTRNTVNACAGGCLMNKTEDEAYAMLEELANEECQWSNPRRVEGRQQGKHEVDMITKLAAQVDILTKQLQAQKLGVHAVQTPQQSCDFCQGNHLSEECQEGNPFMQTNQEQAQYVGNHPSQPPFIRQQAPYNPNWRNHPNFSWKNNQNSGNFQQGGSSAQPERKSDLEKMMEQLTASTMQFMAETRTNHQNQAAQIRNLEATISQLAETIHNRPQGNLPSNTEVNPKEQCKAIALRSGKEIGEGSEQDSPKASRDKEKEIEEEDAPPAQPIPPAEPKLQIPFPQRLRKSKLDSQFARFLEVFKKLHINIPFADALEQMPSYAKFMKEILSKKRKLGDFETVALTEESSAIIQRKLPQKLKDPGSFHIPCVIGNLIFEKALCDLGASINLMPLSLFRKLGLGEAKPTTVTLQMADRSIKHPRGVIEDILVKVGKFIFPADFIVLDMEEDKDIPIILGRPFLATGRALIDVQKGELKLRVNEEEVTFNVFKAMRYPEPTESCFAIDVMEEGIEQQITKPVDALEASLTLSGELDNEDELIEEVLKWLDSFEPNNRKYYEKLGESDLKPIPSTERPPTLELKELPDHLRYAFLGEAETLPVIVSSSLSREEEDKLLRVLRKNKAAIGWSLADLRGISPSMCMHRILLEEITKHQCKHKED